MYRSDVGAGVSELDPMESEIEQQEKPKGRRHRKMRIHPQKEQKRELLVRERAVHEEGEHYKNNIVAELNKLKAKTNMPIVQENGQRTFGPPRNWHGPPPPKGCEVFVGKLPRSVFEPHLVPLFERCGPIYELRLMMDFSGENRGFCFVQYTNPTHAQRAIRDLNDYEIRKGRRIGVVKSMDNCRLFIGGIPTDKTESEIFSEMDKITEGVKRVISYPAIGEEKPKNRGFCFVEYESHKSAAMARRKLIPGKITMWGGVDVNVDWAEPEPEIKTLYVAGLSLNTTEETLYKLFNNVSNQGVEKIQKKKDFAFIHFISREQADSAKQEMNDNMVDGNIIRVLWAKVKQPQQNNDSPVNNNQGFNNKNNNAVIQAFNNNNIRHVHGNFSPSGNLFSPNRNIFSPIRDTLAMQQQPFYPFGSKSPGGNFRDNFTIPHVYPLGPTQYFPCGGPPPQQYLGF